MNERRRLSPEEAAETVFVGLDPGQRTGGLGWIYRDRYGYAPIVLDAKAPIPQDVDAAFLGFACAIPEEPPGVALIIERVSARQGEAAGTSFQFGRSFERCLMLAAHCTHWHPYSRWDISAPGEWQRAFGLWGEFEPETKKLGHAQLAEKIFPRVGLVDVTSCDAMLLAAFSAITWTGRSLRDCTPWLDATCWQ